MYIKKQNQSKITYARLCKRSCMEGGQDWEGGGNTTKNNVGGGSIICWGLNNFLEGKNKFLGVKKAFWG